MTKKTDDIDALVAKMPKRIREHIAELHSKIGALNTALDQRSKLATRVQIVDRVSEMRNRVNQSLPVDTTMRFYTEALALMQANYIEVGFDRQDRDVETLCVRSVNGPLVVLPSASNSIYLAVGKNGSSGKVKL